MSVSSGKALLKLVAEGLGLKSFHTTAMSSSSGKAQGKLVSEKLVLKLFNKPMNHQVKRARSPLPDSNYNEIKINLNK